MADLGGLAIVHPAPHRTRTHLGWLILGLAGAPIAWGAQLVISYALVSHSCYPGSSPRASFSHAGVWPLLVVELLALGIALVGGGVAYRSWQSTREESSGDTSELVEVGRGRTRFLSLWGMMTSLGFAGAIAFSLLGVLLVPLCGF